MGEDEEEVEVEVEVEVEEEEEEDAEQPPQSAGHHFPVGSAVEVLENDASVRYVGTVVPPPRKIDPENQGKLHVIYKSLLAHKGRSERLREFVDVSSVRPSPPPPHKAGKLFELNDVVEAYYDDGWWEGVVTTVLCGGERFVVTFENPPDVVEFAPSRLRPHWDWIDGVWTCPQRKGEIGALKVGEKVEVSIDVNFRGAWFPAVIVRDLGNGAYSVELKEKNVEEEVECGRIRPSPPVLGDGKFGVSEKVDAFFDYGWWTGLIMKKNVKMDEYIVLFEHTDSTKQFDRSELRPHLEWKDGKWLIEGVAEAASSKSRRKSTFSDSRVSLKKHKPQIEEETEHADEDGDDVESDREQRSKQIQDVHIPSMLPLIDEDSRAPNSAQREDSVHADEDGGDVESDGEQRSKRIQDVHIPSMLPLIDDDSRAPNSAQHEDSVQADEDGDDVESDGEQRSKRIQDVHIPSMLPLIDDDSRAPNSVQKLPFVKRNAVWKSIDSMEVLRGMPQRPHFEPLIAFKESQREGLAIGCMVNFTNAVEESRRLKFTDGKSVAEDLLETLLDLETYGFQVGAVRERVMKLLKAKEEEERLVGQAKGVMEQIEVRSGRREKIERDMRARNEHLGRLQEQLKLAEVEMEKEVEEIGCLQAGLEENRQKVESLRADFEGVTASACNGD